MSISDAELCDVVITYGSSPAHILDPDRNMRILKESLKEEPNNTRTLFYLAREHGYRKEWKEAEELFDKYLTLATWLPEKADAYFMLAICHWNEGNTEKAQENCLRALVINPNFKAVSLLLSEMATDKGLLFVRKTLTI